MVEGCGASAACDVSLAVWRGLQYSIIDVIIQEISSQQPRLLGLKQESEAAGGLGRDLPGQGFGRLQDILAK